MDWGATQCKQNSFSEYYYPVSVFSDALGKLLLAYEGATVFHVCSVKIPASLNRKLWGFAIIKK